MTEQEAVDYLLQKNEWFLVKTRDNDWLLMRDDIYDCIWDLYVEDIVVVDARQLNKLYEEGYR